MTRGYTLSFAAYDLDQVVEHAPIQRLRSNDGADVTEHQVLVGHVIASPADRELLEGYGICMDFAHHERREGRWTRCLFSEAAANTLAELSLEGQFPFAFEVMPSAGHLKTLEARASGLPALELPLREWVKPASIEALARAVERGWIQSPWLRRSSGGSLR